MRSSRPPWPQSAIPGFFTSDGSGTGQAAAINHDGSLNPGWFAEPAVQPRGAGITSRPVAEGQVIDPTLYYPSAPVYVRIGKLPAEVLYAGSAPQLVNGVLQLNVRLPRRRA